MKKWTFLFNKKSWGHGPPSAPQFLRLCSLIDQALHIAKLESLAQNFAMLFHNICLKIAVKRKQIMELKQFLSDSHNGIKSRVDLTKQKRKRSFIPSIFCFIFRLMSGTYLHKGHTS